VKTDFLFIVTVTLIHQNKSQAAFWAQEVLYEVWVRFTQNNLWYCAETDFLFDSNGRYWTL